jgi:hypothetical protein
LRGVSKDERPHGSPGDAKASSGDAVAAPHHEGPTTRGRVPAARFRPSDAGSTPLNGKRAQGMPGASRARSLVCEDKKHTSKSLQVQHGQPGIPRAMVLTVSFVLSPVSMTFESPSSARCKASSPTWRQPRGARTTRLRRPRRVTHPRNSARLTQSASIASRPTFRDDRP